MSEYPIGHYHSREQRRRDLDSSSGGGDIGHGSHDRIGGESRSPRVHRPSITTTSHRCENVDDDEVDDHDHSNTTSPKSPLGDRIGRTIRRWKYKANTIVKATNDKTKLVTEVATSKVEEAKHLALIQSHITSLKTTVKIYERELKLGKEKFGIQLYDIMERNNNVGNGTGGGGNGGEIHPKLVETFNEMMNDMKILQDDRKEKFITLTRMNRTLPLALLELQKEKQGNSVTIIT